MRISGLILFLFLLGMTVRAQQTSFEWAIQCNNPPNTTDTKTVIATGHDGYFYLAGEFVDTANFGDEALISEGGTDVSLVRHNSEGSTDWAIRIGSADYDYVQCIGVASSGEVFMAGYFYGTTVIGQDNYTSYGSQDVFLASFNSQGNFLWSARLGGVSADYITAMDIDADDNLVVAGQFFADMAIGDTTLSATGSSDVYLAKFSPDGELIWCMAAGGSSSDQLKDVSCDPEGNIYFTGSYYVDFSIADTTLTTPYPVGGFVAETNPAGQLMKIFQIEGTYLTPDIFVEADHNGDYYLAGNFSEEIYLGDSTFNAGLFNQDIFVAKYDSDGQWIWAARGASIYGDLLLGIDIDAYNNLYITGHTLDTIQFGQLILPYHLCCGSREIFIVSYAFDGKVLWGKQITGPRAGVQSMTVSDDGKLLLSGMFSDTLAFDAIDLSSFSGYRTFITSLAAEIYTGISPVYLVHKNLTIYPNPATSFIKVNGLPNADRVSLFIYNLSGQVLLDGYYNSSDLIFIDGLTPGIYIAKVKDTDGRIISGTFIKGL